MDRSQLTDYLLQKGLIAERRARFTPLAGGVSSDILLVESGSRRFVLKQALDKLRVKDDWFCDTTRNITEYEALQFAATLFPDSVPQLLHGDRENRLFAMEYLDESFTPWKQRLMQGVIDPSIARRTAKLLAKLHASTWGNCGVQRRFNTTESFFALRIEPYLLTTGARHLDLQPLFREEADRLKNTSVALVHGDWSAKNMLVSNERVVVLDWEVAWFGDPAFDSAFFLNLLYLKSLFNRHRLNEYLGLMNVFRQTYREQLADFNDELERRIAHLTLMLLLARIDGKSPAEYITDAGDKNFVRRFVHRSLIERVHQAAEIDRRWRKAVAVA